MAGDASYQEVLSNLKTALRLIKHAGDELQLSEGLMESVRDVAWMEAKLAHMIKVLEEQQAQEAFGAQAPGRSGSLERDTLADKQIRAGNRILSQAGFSDEDKNG